YTATGECTLRANDRTFSSDDGSITVQTLENEEPHRVYGDVTTPDGGQVYTTDIDADLEYSASDDEIEVSGEMTDYLDPDAAAVAFTITATCS
ncbi:MAG: hypothetical protein HKN41_00805, partial [Ilumatobacter sp.]|nr:hypothetical protein [Ilumatobacter sp.]